MDLEKLRREYLQEGLNRASLADDPIRQFQIWLNQAIDAQIQDPTAMTVATVDTRGQPSQRIVLLKQVTPGGFVFFTNYNSHKARDLAHNPLVSLHFPWHQLERQVKICGTAGKISTAESMKYFISRPRDSQLAAWASKQSRSVSSRQILMQQFHSMKQKFSDGTIPLPDFWGGYRVTPSSIEFWQGGADRLHDRFRYVRSGKDWSIERLAP
ncbi:MAG: pyridoxamine 5'-phosphate oxidase [Gammaproteobacteria bacterium]|nr:pyridoxamine 5'-phosphate oxidase [Gammaproteobacteria bacterium]